MTDRSKNQPNQPNDEFMNAIDRAAKAMAAFSLAVDRNSRRNNALAVWWVQRIRKRGGRRNG